MCDVKRSVGNPITFWWLNLAVCDLISQTLSIDTTHHSFSTPSSNTQQQKMFYPLT